MYKVCRKKLLVVFMVFVLIMCSIPIGYISYADDAQKLFEAEQGLLYGTEKASTRAGFSGTGYVNSFDNMDDNLIMNVEVDAKGFYNLDICYASEDRDATADLYINGNSQGSILFKQSSKFDEILAGKILLHAGLNEIRLYKKSGSADIDYIKIGWTYYSGQLSVSDNLVNENASQKAGGLMKLLEFCYGKAIISGQQSIEKTIQIGRLTGKKPAITSFDFAGCTPENSAAGKGCDETDKAIEWAEQGGIVSFNWAWDIPVGTIGEDGKVTLLDIEKALYNSESSDYQTLTGEIKTVANQLIKLQNRGIPVLWRPFGDSREQGSRLGAKGAGIYKSLYRFLYKELTEKYNLNNLVWVWTTTSDKEEALTWYPGDEYVDIISTDIHLKQHDFSACSVVFRNIDSLFKGKKLVTMSENSTLPDPDKLIPEKAGWSWFCTSETGMGDMLRSELDQLKKVYNSQYVITLDELPDIRKEAGITDANTEIIATHTPTYTPRPTPTATPTYRATSAPTAMPTDKVTAVSTPTPTATATSTPTPAATATATATSTQKPTATAAATPTPTIPYMSGGYCVSGYLAPDFQFKANAAPIVRSYFKVGIAGTNYFAYTDTTGYFEINGVPYGKDHIIEIKKSGFLLRVIKDIVVTRDTEISKYSSPIKMWGGDIPDKGVQDNALNMKDIVLVASRFNRSLGDGYYVEDYDIDKDTAISMCDIMIIARHFNRYYNDY